MKVFISGPMTGHPEYNFPAFNQAAEMLTAQGYEVVNPASLFSGLTSVPPWEECVKIAIVALMGCDAIYALEGWEKSRGANIEIDLARKLGYRFVGSSRHE